ncbi:MAG TPA: cell division protein ZapA [Kosmotogaceae bacterium]|nr:MAG: Uncharacterized protein XE05_0024 [Thermotogales bacterium 46_20]HAA84834.1 cell division protein ZapA [Kosmotogaceae bacterium]
MKRPVILKLAEREFRFYTTEPEDIVETVFQQIVQTYDELEIDKSKVELEYVLTAMLVEITADLVKSRNELERMREKYSSILEQYHRSRRKIEE